MSNTSITSYVLILEIRWRKMNTLNEKTKEMKREFTMPVDVKSIDVLYKHRKTLEAWTLIGRWAVCVVESYWAAKIGWHGASGEQKSTERRAGPFILGFCKSLAPVLFHVLKYRYSVVSAPLVENIILSLLNFLCIFVKTQSFIHISLFLSSLLCSIDLCVYPFANTRPLWLMPSLASPESW